MSDTIEITLPGIPRGKGRPRFSVRNGQARAYTDAQTASFEGALRMMAKIAMRGREPLTGPIDVMMVAVLPVPASWSKTKRKDALDGRIRPTVRPDFDNYMKCCDALNSIVWVDDAQVVDGALRKWYGAEPSLSISVKPWVSF